MSILTHIPHNDVDEDLPDYTREYESKMLAWATDATDEAQSTLQLSKEYSKVQEYISCLEGDGWWSNSRPRFLSRFVDNKLAHTRYATLSTLTDLRPVIDVQSRVKAFQAQANAARGIIRYEWFNQDLDLSLVSVADAALLFGNGFWKIGASTPGFMTFTPCGPDMVMPIQPGLHIQDSTAVLFRTYKPINYFKQRFPARCANLEEESVGPGDQYQGTTISAKPPRVDEYTWTNMSPQMKAKIGIKQTSSRPAATPYPVIELREFWVDDPALNESTKRVLMRATHMPLDEQNFKYWVEPGRPLYPRKRLIVYAGNRLMYDGPSPYWHGLYPFAMLRLNPVMWSFWGLSKYRDLMPINRAVNEIVAGTLDMCKRALNPQVITKEGGVPKAAWESYFPNMPGGKLRLGPASNPLTDVRYMDSPQLPSYVFQMLGSLVQEFERLSGFMDASRIAGKKQVPGGESIEQMRDMQNTSARLEGRYVEAFLRDAGDIAIPNIFQCYTASRRLHILGADGLTWEDFDYNPSDPGSPSFERMIPDGVLPENHVRNFSLEIAPGSLLGTNKERNKLMAIKLLQVGGLSVKSLLQTLDIPDPDKILKEMVEEHKMGIGPGAGKHGGGLRMTRGERQGDG